MNPIQQQKHIFIIGSAFSGTTLIYRMLGYDPELAWVSKFCISRYPFLRYWVPLAQKIFKHSYSKNSYFNLKEKILWNIIPTPIEAGKKWRHIFPETKMNKIHGLQEALRYKKPFEEFVQLILRNQNKKRFLAKSPILLVAHSCILHSFPHSKVLFVFKNPFDLAAKKFNKSQNNHNIDYKELIQYWIFGIKIALKGVQSSGSDQFILLSYSDFCKNPKMTMKNLYQKCELKNFESIKEYLPSYIQYNIQNKFNLFSHEEKKIIQNEILNSFNPIEKKLFEKYCGRSLEEELFLIKTQPLNTESKI